MVTRRNRLDLELVIRARADGCRHNVRLICARLGERLIFLAQWVRPRGPSPTASCARREAPAGGFLPAPAADCARRQGARHAGVSAAALWATLRRSFRRLAHADRALASLRQPSRSDVVAHKPSCPITKARSGALPPSALAREWRAAILRMRCSPHPRRLQTVAGLRFRGTGIPLRSSARTARDQPARARGRRAARLAPSRSVHQDCRNFRPAGSGALRLLPG